MVAVVEAQPLLVAAGARDRRQHSTSTVAPVPSIGSVTV
jgi:hypothetical protein